MLISALIKWGEGGNSKNGCFWRKTNSSGNQTILSGIGRLGKFSGRHNVKKLNFWEYLPKIRDDIPDFREDFYLHMALLKQYLLELSPSPSVKVLQIQCGHLGTLF